MFDLEKKGFCGCFRLHHYDTVEELRKFLLTTFPPKHLRSVPTAADDTSGESDKKVLQKLVCFYHTDRVNKEEHGLKYYVLCEEIAKVVTNRYNEMKGCD